MGFRFRKSVKLFGGLFRLNFSGSGIGASIGVKGARTTLTSRGTVRETLSLPGSGVSYVQEHRPKKSPKVSQKEAYKQLEKDLKELETLLKKKEVEGK